MSTNILEINKLSKYFGGLAAVSDCSLKVKEGTITGIIGPNGSGKTTLFNLIAGNLQSSSGSVIFNNENITGLPSYELLKVMSVWLVKKGIKRSDAQKYITSLFLALSEDAVVNSKKELKFLVKESQTPKGLNEQGLKSMSKKGVYKSVVNTLNSIHKRLS